MTNSKKKLSSKKVELSGTIMELIHGIFKKSREESIALQYILHKKYNIPKSTLSRKLKELENKGVIVSLSEGKPKFYSLVGHKVPKILTRREKPSPYRLHNIELSFKIIKHPNQPLREQWKLNNWIGSKQRFGDVTARFTTKNLILYLQGYGKNPAEALASTMVKASGIINMIKNKRPDLVLSPFPIVNRKMHYAVPTPKDIKKIADNIQVSGKGWKIDESEGEGEIEFVSKDPFELIEKAQSFANMPDRIKTLEQTNNNFLGILENQQKQLLSLQQITQGLQTSLQRIVSPFAGESFSQQKNMKQKKLKDFIKETEDIKYIG